MFEKLRKLNKEQVYSVLHQLVMAVYGFGLLFVLYRTSSKEETGRWLLFMSAISLADMLLHGFLQTTVIRRIAAVKGNKAAIDKIASNAFYFAITLWLSISVVFMGASQLFSLQLLEDLKWYPLLGFMMLMYNVSWWVGHGLLDFKSILLQRIVFCLVSSLLLLAFYQHGGQLFTNDIIISQVFAYGVSATIGWLVIRKIKLSFNLFDIEVLDYFMKYGKFTSGSMLLSSLLRNADVFMIAGFLGQASVAVYGAAQKMVEVFEVGLRGMASHALPDFCRSAHDHKGLLKKYVVISALLIFLFTPVALLMAIFAEWVIGIISGSSQYLGAANVLRILMVYVLFLVVDRMTGIVLEALGLASYNLRKTMLLVLVNVVGNFIALYFFQSIIAVAVVSIVAALVGTGAGLYFTVQYMGITLTAQHFKRGYQLIIK
ncbi:MAG: oligosaccharide flippase family protein [Chitinophagales bacterium]|nr:oligosaccharide flippase family protein [Chitinophagales bacterium]